MRLTTCTALILSLLLGLTVGLHAAEEKRTRTDLYGDPLPSGAVARCGSARLRVDDRVAAFAFWPDDRTLAACCWDGWIRLWDRTTGREVRRMDTGLLVVESFVFVPRSKLVAFTDVEDHIVLWDSETGKARWKAALEGHTGKDRLAASPNGKLLAVGPGKIGQVHLYEIATGRKIRSLKGAVNRTIQIVFSPDSSRLALIDRTEYGAIWDVSSGKEICNLPDIRAYNGRCSLTFSQNGKWIAGGSYKEVFVADAATGKERNRFTIRHFTRPRLLFTVDERTLLIASSSGLFFHDSRTGKKQRKVLEGFESWPVLSADGKALAVVSANGQPTVLHLLDPATGKELLATEGHNHPLTQVVFSPDGRTLLSRDWYNLRSWDAGTGKQKQCIDHFFDRAAVSSDQKLLAGANDFGIVLRDWATGKKLRLLEHNKSGVVHNLAFCAGDRLLLATQNRASSTEGQAGLYVWDLNTGKGTLRPLDLTDEQLETLVVTPDGAIAIAGSAPERADPFAMSSSRESIGRLFVWDVGSGRPVRTLIGHRGSIASLSVSSDGRLLVSGSSDDTFRLWDLLSGKTIFTVPAKTLPLDKHPLTLHLKTAQESITSLSPDGLLLATSNGGKGSSAAILFWSTVTGKPLGKLSCARSHATALAFSPDGGRLASGLANGTALVWDVAALHRQARDEARQPGSRKLEELWTDLASADAARARQALWHLVARGEEAVRLLEGRLKPRAGVEAKRLQKLLAGLDADGFAQREAASKELEQMGELAEPALRAAQKGRVSAEVHRRIRAILTHLDRQGPPAEQLRELRAVEVLERVGSKQARMLLARLAEGIPEARLTRAARASRERLRH